ncbi:helix-turn-helix domain-containing protein [Streptomyces sp. NPDC048172]|uniref:helix-turn-helix domain-containing protein n=1 Tax=Streptomyces sp. NPDC048172 TaxID=3365505 RepID=UPI0037234721
MIEEEDQLPTHEVRTALLALLDEAGTVTATQAAARLGYSSGLCSFHLRQLARYGRIEEAPRGGGGRGGARPWRLRTAQEAAAGPEGFGELARGLEDESYQRWLASRDAAPEEWRRDEAFSEIVHLTPEEMTAVAEAVRSALAPYRARETDAGARPAGARPVAVVSRVFPLLPGDEAGRAARAATRGGRDPRGRRRG